jgi:nitrous oxidase accessory protein NosD
MRSGRVVRIASALTASLLVGGALITAAGSAVASVRGGSRWRNVLYVSPDGQQGNRDVSCNSAGYQTVQSAVDAARARGTVVVCRGTYNEQVVISKPLTLQGRHAVIDETGVTPSLTVNVPGLGELTIFAGVVILHSGVTFSGFEVTNALGEGILAAGITGTISGISIDNNRVVHNDLGGGVPPASTYFECQPEGQAPGDCGEGVHFIAVAYSKISHNFVYDNSGGILLTDETGPTHGNVIEDNVVSGNASDCGITVPGHNPNALNAAGQPQPSVAGVYDNVIRHNVITDNGVEGEGAGVLFANASAGTASYNNLVEDNYIAGNGLSGVTMHAHTIAPGQFEDLSGNKIIGNVIGKNNLDGDTLDSPVSPEDLATTGVLVFSGGTPVTVTVARNIIFNNTIGIWLSAPVTAKGLPSNSFYNVQTNISANN